MGIEEVMVDNLQSYWNAVKYAKENRLGCLEKDATKEWHTVRNFVEMVLYKRVEVVDGVVRLV